MYRRYPTYGNGLELADNMKHKRPTRTLNWSNYLGRVMEPTNGCGLKWRPRNNTTAVKAPWVQLKDDGTLQSIDREIHNFMHFIEPTKAEMLRRKDLVQRFTALIASFDTSYSVQPVGSYVTGLYLPTSDIDMVLTISSTSTPLYALQNIMHRLRASGFASKVEDVLRAKVPLIRITDKVTSIEIDLTASDTHGIQATEAVQRWLKGETEIKRMLIMVVKEFLAVRGCGSTYTGGINSYVLVWMVVAWVEIEWPKLKNPSSADAVMRRPLAAAGAEDLTAAMEGLTIGATRGRPSNTIPQYRRALRSFFKFYGTKFDYETQAIEIEPRPLFDTKIAASTQKYLLTIYDPAGRSDMGAKAYGIKHVKATFASAYEKMLIASRKESSDPDKGTAAYPDGFLHDLLYT